MYEQDNIQLTRSEYEALVIAREKYRMLTKALTQHATLSWRKGELNLDSDTASTCLRVMEQFNYERKVEQLERRKEDDSNE